MGLKVMERARRNPHEREFSVAYPIDVEALRRACNRICKKAAVGVNGVTKEQYGQHLEKKLKDMHQRMKAAKYRHQPIFRAHVPKEENQT
jgi:retron-type reverse transcriptase